MIRRKLRPYQSEARDRALAHPGFALFPEPRTGKTLISYAIADARRPARLLIVCPVNAIGEWKAGLADWTDHDCEVMITTYGMVSNKRRRAAICRWLEKTESGMIADEFHKIKRRGSAQSRSIRVLGRRADWRLGLTGTPIAQGLHDAWAYFDFLDPSVFGPYRRFEKRFCKMGGYRRFNKWTNRREPTQIVGFKNKKTFARILGEHSFRVRLGEVTPTKVRLRYRKIYGELSPREERAYREIETELKTMVRDEEVTAPLVITKSMKLHQLTGGFLIGNSREDEQGRSRKGRVYRLGSSKLDLLRGALRDSPRREKVVVIARFRHEIRAIQRTLETLGRTVHVIEKATPWERRFWSDVVILQSAQAASIDLSSSSRIIFYSWDYSYINHEQARFRVLSYTQTRATYDFLLIRGSIDELLYQAIRRKKKLADLVCDKYRRRVQ